MRTSKTGHEQNVTNADELKTRVVTFENFLPPRQELTEQSLTQLNGRADTAMTNVVLAENVVSNAITERRLAFDDLDKIVTSAINALRICGAPEQTVTQAEVLVRELRGKRASEKLSDEEIEALKAEGKEVNQNTLHNSSFTSIAETFGKFASFLGTVTQYNPNETNITKAALTTKAVVLKAVNQTMATATAALDAARIARDVVLYTEKSGLVDICKDVKLYVKSAYGSDSPQYKSISDLSFTRPKK
jgi:hypothetical protein